MLISYYILKVSYRNPQKASYRKHIKNLPQKQVTGTHRKIAPKTNYQKLQKNKPHRKSCYAEVRARRSADHTADNT